MKTALRHRASSPHAAALAVVATVAHLLCCVPARADEAASVSFRLQGGGFACGGTTASGATTRSISMIGPVSPAGTAEGETLRMGAGRQIPEVVSRILRFVLGAGWNLKGAPMHTEQTVGDTFVGNGGHAIKIGDIYEWDLDEYRALANTDSMTANRGFWVFSYWGGTSQQISGSDGSAAPLLDQVGDGWSLYSPTHYINVPDSDRIVIVWGWDTELQQYQPLGPGAVLHPLQAYWIFKLSEDAEGR